MPYGKAAGAVLSGLTIIWRLWQTKRLQDTIIEAQVANLEKPEDTRRIKYPPSHHVRYYHHPKDDEHRTFEELVWVGSFCLASVTTVAAVIAASFAVAGWNQSRRQADIAHDTLVATTRAYINLGFPGFEKSDASLPDSTNLYVLIKNSGLTRPRRFILKQYCVVYSASGIESNWKKMLVSKPTNIIPLGAQDEERAEGGETCSFKDSALREIASKRSLILTLGLATYLDAIDPTASHRTEFCYIQTVNAVRPTDGGFGGLVSTCPEAHNCADEGCSN